MNDRLKNLLINVFSLTENEFKDSLNKEAISNWDSLRHMDLIATIEAEYDITLDMKEILSISSFAEIQEILEGKNIDTGR